MEQGKRQKSKKQNKPRKSQPENYVKTKYNLFLTFILLVTAFLIYDTALISFDYIDIDNLRQDLVENIHKQREAVDLTLKSIGSFYNDSQAHLLNFIGPSGVGKTYMVNLIKKHFHATIFEFSAHQLDMTANILSKLTKWNLIILEDLNVDHIPQLRINLLENISEDMPIFVICIFNIQQTDKNLNYFINQTHIDVITNEFKQFDNIKIDNLVFHEFTKEDLEDFLKNKKNINSATDLNKIVENHSVKEVGLKGLNANLLKYL